jgi:2-polyprenyl-6-methoxyphenol hydroxylase-like FAD-dependent oxidoreductase
VTRGRTALVSGAGIAGPTIAYWLKHSGFETTIVEHASQPRTGGYIIDFWGSGFRVADRMNLRPQLEQHGYRVRELRVVNSSGKRTAGASVTPFLRVTGGRYVTIARGNLAAILFEAVGSGIETIFGDSITRLDESKRGVRVAFQAGAEREFDIVIGADGPHSRVRELMLGSALRWERYLGIRVAAFDIQGYEPRDEDVYVMYTEVGRQAARFSARNDRTTVLLTWLDSDASSITDPQRQREYLRQRFAGAGWEVPKMLDCLDGVRDLYFDRVSQIRIEPPASWHRGRVALVGDAAFCASLLAGEGSSLAMTGAYILANELRVADDDPAAAFDGYERRFRPYVEAKQRSAMRFASTFAPKSRFAIAVRNIAIELMGWPLIGERLVAAQLRDSAPSLTP